MQQTVEALDARAHWFMSSRTKAGGRSSTNVASRAASFRTRKQAIEAAKEHARAHGDWDWSSTTAADASPMWSPFSDHFDDRDRSLPQPL